MFVDADEGSETGSLWGELGVGIMLTSVIGPLTNSDFPVTELESVDDVADVMDCIRVSVDAFE